MGMILDGILTNSHVDSSGEIVDVAGMDISDILEGKAQINYEHEPNGPDPEDTLGTLRFAKKIFKAEDCDDDRQKLYWAACNKPFIYIIGELADDALHPGAICLAALLRFYARQGGKMMIGWSVEGSTLKRDGNVLQRSVARKAALTLRACNKACLAGLVSDPAVEKWLRKAAGSGKTPQIEVDGIIVSDDFVAQIEDDLEGLRKALTAGMASSSPSQASGGAALQREDLEKPMHQLSRWDRNRLRSKYRDWNKTRPLKEYLKAELPDVSPSYIEHFADVVRDINLRKGMAPPLRIGPEHSKNPSQSEAQKRLIDGLYLDRSTRFEVPGVKASQKIMKLRNDQGHVVLVKPPRLGSNGREHADNAEAYHHVAARVFGLGANVPVTNHFEVPGAHHGAKTYQAMEYLADHKIPMIHDTTDAMEAARKTGVLHRLAVLDYVMGAGGDRHQANVMVSPRGEIKHVDNDDALHYDGPNEMLTYPLMGHDAFPATTRTWLAAIDGNRLAAVLHGKGVPHALVQRAKRRLEVAQDVAARGGSLHDMHDADDAVYHDLDADANMSGGSR
jgi:hypothetical protein